LLNSVVAQWLAHPGAPRSAGRGQRGGGNRKNVCSSVMADLLFAASGSKREKRKSAFPSSSISGGDRPGGGGPGPTDAHHTHKPGTKDLKPQGQRRGPHARRGPGTPKVPTGRPSPGGRALRPREVAQERKTKKTGRGAALSSVLPAQAGIEDEKRMPKRPGGFPAKDTPTKLHPMGRFFLRNGGGATFRFGCSRLSQVSATPSRGTGASRRQLRFTRAVSEIRRRTTAVEHFRSTPGGPGCALLSGRWRGGGGGR